MSVKNQDWHAEQIKAAVRMKEGKSLAQLSREAGLKPDTMRNVFRCHIPRYEAIIAGYVTSADAEDQQIVIRTEAAVKKNGDLLSQVVSMSRANLSSLQSAVNAGSLEVIEGRLGLKEAP